MQETRIELIQQQINGLRKDLEHHHKIVHENRISFSDYLGEVYACAAMAIEDRLSWFKRLLFMERMGHE